MVNHGQPCGYRLPAPITAVPFHFQREVDRKESIRCASRCPVGTTKENFFFRYTQCVAQAQPWTGDRAPAPLLGSRRQGLPDSLM